jgi:ribonuclease BN (tRNA processing enzyme)
MTAMKLTIVGCAGSFPGPDSPSSCYLVEAPFEGGTYRLALDLGNGALGALQRHIDLRDLNAVAISHLHADHCFDLAGYYVVSRYHPEGALERLPLFAPAGAARFLAVAYGPEPDPGILDHFSCHDWRDGETLQMGPFRVTVKLMDHPVEAYAMRIEAGGKVLVYSGDTGPTDVLNELAAGADLFLCEASFVESKAKLNPPHLHLTGAQAGEAASAAGVGHLLLTHIPAWTDRAEVESDAKTTWDGPLDLVTTDATYEL